MAWQLDTEFTVGGGSPVRRYRFDNGLVVLAAQNRSAPIVAVQTWFRVGSRNEAPGATGLAHLFEHLMFGATQTRPAGEFDRVVERTGGESNAATWVDWTYYRLTVPARDLALALDLEHERMDCLALDPAAVEAERDVVTNERRERVEDDVDGWLDEQLMALAFTEHPYRWPTIGWMSDIRAVSLDTIREFYRTWYAPNNAILVVVGDFADDELLALVAARQGSLLAASTPLALRPTEPVQTEARMTRAAKPIATHRILIGYKAPSQHDPQWAHLEILATLLAGCPSARLHRRLVIDTEIASSVDAQLTPFAEPSLFRISITCARGHDADEVLRVVDEELARLINEPCSEQELQKAKHLAETDFWSGIADIDGKAEALGHHETALGDFRSVALLATRLAEATPADIHRAAQQYFVPTSRSLVIADPDGDEDGDDDEVDNDNEPTHEADADPLATREVVVTPTPQAVTT
ncbi:MAG: insulinase family protein [Kofleriaceae bacterium]|nr:insulinase family protein [Kofleriaceae bacterium]